MKKKASEKPRADPAKDINVELDGEVRRRLLIYKAKTDETIKAVVNAALDEYLKQRGA